MAVVGLVSRLASGRSMSSLHLSISNLPILIGQALCSAPKKDAGNGGVLVDLELRTL